MSTHKNCAHCGAQNDPMAKYCQNCGAQLPKDKSQICPACKTKNEPTARFCKQCGQSLRGVKARQGQRNPKKNNIPLLVLAGILGFFILFIFVRSLQTPAGPNQMAQPAVSGDIAVEASVSQIASLFWCACGNCNDSLEKCACPTAQEERNFIQRQVQNQSAQQKIIQEVKKKYGLLKTDFKEFNSAS